MYWIHRSPPSQCCVEQAFNATVSASTTPNTFVPPCGRAYVQRNRTDLLDDLRGQFQWTTGSGDTKLVSQMSNSHLVNAIGWCQKIIATTQKVVEEAQKSETFILQGCEISFVGHGSVQGITKDDLTLKNWISIFQEELAWRDQKGINIVD